MISALSTILAFQLIGEVIAHALDLALPGPVIGLILLICTGLLRPAVIENLRPAANGLLAHLSLFFVPAGVGIVAHIGQLRDNALGIILALVVSTVLAIAVAALAFTWVARWLGLPEVGPEGPVPAQETPPSGSTGGSHE